MAKKLGKGKASLSAKGKAGRMSASKTKYSYSSPKSGKFFVKKREAKYGDAPAQCVARIKAKRFYSKSCGKGKGSSDACRQASSIVFGPAMMVACRYGLTKAKGSATFSKEYRAAFPGAKAQGKAKTRAKALVTKLRKAAPAGFGAKRNQRRKAALGLAMQLAKGMKGGQAGGQKSLTRRTKRSKMTRSK